MNPIKKQAKVGNTNTGNQRWIGRRIRRLFTAAPSRVFLRKVIFLSFSESALGEASAGNGARHGYRVKTLREWETEVNNKNGTGTSVRPSLFYFNLLD